MPKAEMVNHPAHYNEHPSGVECIDIIEHMNFCLGNAMKYIWRADLKGEAIQDLEKAIFYIKREIERRGSKKESTRESDTGEHTPRNHATILEGWQKADN